MANSMTASDLIPYALRTWRSPGGYSRAEAVLRWIGLGDELDAEIAARLERRRKRQERCSHPQCTHAFDRRCPDCGKFIDGVPLGHDAGMRRAAVDAICQRHAMRARTDLPPPSGPRGADLWSRVRWPAQCEAPKNLAPIEAEDLLRGVAPDHRLVVCELLAELHCYPASSRREEYPLPSPTTVSDEGRRWSFGS